MLDKNDLQAIAKLLDNRAVKTEQKLQDVIDRRIKESELRTAQQIDRRIKESEKRIGRQIDRRIKESEVLVLNELDLVEGKLERQFTALRKDVEEQSSFYRSEKIEQYNFSLLVKIVDDLTERVTKLESRSA